MSLPLRDRWGTNSMALDNIRAPNPWWVCPSDCGFHLIVSVFFSRMRSKGSRFTLGVWGLSVCSLDVAFVVATVHTRPQPFARSPYGRAYGKFCRRGAFCRFQTCGCFVSRGRRGTSWHSDVFCNVSTVVLCGRRNTIARVSEDGLYFSWQAQHFGRVHRHFAWQAQHFRRIALAGLRQVATRCNFCGGRGILWDVLKTDGSLARNIDFEEANLEVPKKTHRKTSILKLHSVKVSSWVSGFPVASPCLWGKLQNPSFLNVATQVVMSFCVAGAALCDIPTCFLPCRKCQN